MSKYLLVCMGIALASVAEARIAEGRVVLQQAEVTAVNCSVNALGGSGTIELASDFMKVIKTDADSCRAVMEATAKLIECDGMALAALSLERNGHDQTTKVKVLGTAAPQSACASKP